MNISIDIIAGLIAIALFIVWLVRLEGRVNGLSTSKAEATAVAVTNEKIAALEASAKVHESTKEEVIRLQEQIKHLTGLVEGWLRDHSPTGRPPRSQPRRAD